MNAPNQGVSLGIVAARLYWMLFGPLILLVVAYRIASSGSNWHIGYDFAFVVAAAAMLFARWREFRTGKAETADGLPLSAIQFQRYCWVAAISCFGAWIAAQGFRQYWM